MTGASTASAAHASTMARPTVAGTESPRAAIRRQPAALETRGAGSDDAASASVVAGVVMVSGTDAGVEEHVGGVAEDVGGDGEEHRDEGAGLDQRDVLEERGLQHHP